jgi:NADPH:quinone reductase-like Zn-dependent oxidoreductase
MKAIFKATDGSLEIRETPDAVPAVGQALVRVDAISLNYGELKHAEPNGKIIGWDAAGVVVQAVPGSQAIGTRVLTFGYGNGWAELRAVDVHEMAAIPDAVETGAAAALPVAGVTALRALRAGGDLTGKRVLVTGASGGVGRFAVQLGQQLGAQIIASVGSPERGADLPALGAAEVVVGVQGITQPLDFVVDNVGGDLFDGAMRLLKEGGKIMVIGSTSGRRGGEALPGRTAVPFQMGTQIGPDMAYLLDLVAAGQLDPNVSWRGPWTEINTAAKLLFDRQLRGKAILDVVG